MKRWDNRFAPRLIPRIKLARARELRQQGTIAEMRAWRLLRDRRMLGLKFKRQKVIADLIVDFYCAELRLVLELDGSVHSDADRAAYDAARTAHLEARGFRVVRLQNDALSPRVLRALLADLIHRSPSRSLTP